MKEPGGILGQASEADEDAAHDILERLEDVSYSITPKRVVFASIMALLIALASIFAIIWVVPYENVDVEVVYMQAGSGHVVLVELDNKGSHSFDHRESEFSADPLNSLLNMRVAIASPRYPLRITAKPRD